jgi:hypothetical protein
MIISDANNRLKPKKSRFLHSPAHVLADEICAKLNDKRHYGFYLKMALNHDPGQLRTILGHVLEQNAKNPGALFVFLVKKNLSKQQDA